MKNRWSEAESDRAVIMYWQGATYYEIGAVLGRTFSSVRHRLQDIKWGVLQGYESEPKPRLNCVVSPRSAVPGWVIRERNERLSRAPRSLTAAIMGDPEPGRSALDRRSA